MMKLWAQEKLLIYKKNMDYYVYLIMSFYKLSDFTSNQSHYWQHTKLFPGLQLRLIPWK